MGVYIYSLRAKTVALTMPSGEKVRANLYSYAYKMTSYWKGDRGYNSYNLMVENTKRHGSNAFDAPRSGVVIVGDAKDDLDGHSVYTNVTTGEWCDVERFPGTLVGWVERVGKSLRVADRTKWSSGQVHDNGVWKPYRSRSVMVDGKATTEQIIEAV
jgi:hypothetical protein